MFLLLYLLVVGGVSADLLWQVRRALGAGWRWRAVAVVVLAAVAGLPLMHAYGDALPPGLRQGLTLFSQGWLFLMLWLLFGRLLLGLWQGTLWIIGWWLPAARRLRLSPQLGTGLCWLLSATLLLCALAQGRALRVREITILSDRIAFDAPPLRVAFISDLHLGRSRTLADATRMAETIARLHPDLILCGGDLVDASDGTIQEQIAPFAALRPPLGKFAVLGNHEVYAGVEKSQALLRRAGFELLRNQQRAVGSEWLLVGVDDPHAEGLAAGPYPLEELLLPERRGTRYTLLLKHRPELTAAAQARAELQLSGHTHAGQVFPFNLVVRRLFPWCEGVLHTPAPGFALYVSPGTGTWGLPARLGSTSEVTLLEIRPQPVAD